MPEKYDNYVFDLYGTLVDIRTDESKNSLWKELALFYGYQKAHYSPLEIKRRYHELVEEALKEKKAEQSARYGHEAYPDIKIEGVFEKLYREKNVEPDEALLRYTCQMFRIESTEWLKLYPGATELLKKLKKQGSKVYLLSNAQRQFTERELNALGISSLFDGILISSDHEVSKPDPEFFKLLQTNFGIDFSRSLMIGNDSKNDIGGAAAVGMEGFYLRSAISPADDPTPNCKYVMEDLDLVRAADILCGIK